MLLKLVKDFWTIASSETGCGRTDIEPTHIKVDCDCVIHAWTSAYGDSKSTLEIFGKSHLKKVIKNSIFYDFLKANFFFFFFDIKASNIFNCFKLWRYQGSKAWLVNCFQFLPGSSFFQICARHRWL